MPASVRVQYVGPHDAVEVVAVGVTARRGEVMELGGSVAGRVPGGWSPVESGGPVDDGRQYRRAGSGWEARDPGAGLLAQEDVWVPAPQVAARRTTVTREG